MLHVPIVFPLIFCCSSWTLFSGFKFIFTSGAPGEGDYFKELFGEGIDRKSSFMMLMPISIDFHKIVDLNFYFLSLFFVCFFHDTFCLSRICLFFKNMFVFHECVCLSRMCLSFTIGFVSSLLLFDECSILISSFSIITDSHLNYTSLKPTSLRRTHE